MCNPKCRFSIHKNIVTNMTIVRQRLANHVPERYAVNKNRSPLLVNGYGYHGSGHVPVTTRT
jgi:hypothetical protein